MQSNHSHTKLDEEQIGTTSIKIVVLFIKIIALFTLQPSHSLLGQAPDILSYICKIRYEQLLPATTITSRVLCMPRTPGGGQDSEDCGPTQNVAAFSDLL